MFTIKSIMMYVNHPVHFSSKSEQTPFFPGRYHHQHFMSSLFNLNVQVSGHAGACYCVYRLSTFLTCLRLKSSSSSLLFCSSCCCLLFSSLLFLSSSSLLALSSASLLSWSWAPHTDIHRVSCTVSSYPSYECCSACRGHGSHLLKLFKSWTLSWRIHC